MSTPTIAHEGNPRATDALVVTGTLDGTATLLIQYPPQIEERPLPSAKSLTKSVLTGTCPDVFTWNSDRKDPFVEGWTTKYLEAQSYNGITRPAETALHDNNLSVLISPSPKCYGVMYVPLPLGVSTFGSVLRVQARYSFLSLVSGAPRAGICCFIQDKYRDPDNITVVGLVTDWDAGTTGLYYWRNSSLGQLHHATTLYETSYTPAAGELFQLVRDYSSGSFTISASILTAAGDLDNWFIDNAGAFPLDEISTVTVGLIAIGGGKTGQVRFGGNEATSYSASDPTRITAFYRQRGGIVINE